MRDIKKQEEKNEESVVPSVFQYLAEQMQDAILVFDGCGKVLCANPAASTVYGYSAEEFQNFCVRDLYLPTERHCIEDQMKVAQFVPALHQKRDGTIIPVQIRFGKAFFGEREVLVGIVRECSENKKDVALISCERKYQLLHEEHLASYEELTASAEELRQQFDELVAKEEKIYRQNTVLNLLHDTTIGLMADLDHEDILEKIVYGVREFFNAPNSFVHFVNEEKEAYILKTGTGVFKELVNEGKITEGLIGQAYRTGKLAIVDNYSSWQYRLSDPIFDKLHYFALFPLKHRNTMIGAIGLAFSEPDRSLSDDEISLLQRFGDLAALALRNASLVTSLHNKINEYEQTEKQLRQSEEKFSQSFFVSPDAISITQQDGTYVEVNQGFTRISGFSAEEAIGKKTIELGLWTDCRDWERMVAALKSQGELREIEVPFRHKDGHIIYGQVSACMLNLNGEPCYMVGVRDITARMQADKVRRQQEEALLASRNKLAMAAGLANLGPWEYNPGTGLFEFGDEFYAVYGTDVAREGRFMSVEDYIRKFVHPEEAWMFEDEKKFLSSGEQLNSSDVGHRIIRRDGAVRNIIVRRNVFRDADGKIIKAYGTNQDITERVLVEEERYKQAETIKRMAYFDSLTGLANRHHFNEWLNREMERARRGEASGVILFIDLDDLKMVNDTYGHTCGDKIIITAGARIADGVGKEAFVARIGGDEFVVVLPGMYDEKEINESARKISKSLGRKQEIFGTHFHMAASIGIASYPVDGDTTEEVVKNADNAMYAAKKSGKNCWRFYTAAMQSEAYKKMRLTAGLRYALERGEFLLLYQPQILTSERTVIGFEALLRWNSPEYGIVAPIQFVPLAEQSGLIYSIGQWVLREACQFARRLADQGWGGVHVAVNISSKQIAADNFIAVVRSAMKEAGIQAHQLELEITESLLMTSLEEGTIKLDKLKNLGVHLSLDDFGTGFSSLTYLRRLPVETLKIDKSFIDMITTDAQGAKIIGSIISMAHTINMKVVAEGVETAQQFEYLAGHGCDRIQGYIFSQPVPEAEAIKLLSGKVC